MAKFYGQVGGNRGVATRTGSSSIKASIQSWDGSIISTLSYNSENKLMVEVRADDYSTSYGNRIFYGTYEEFVNKLKS